MSTPVLVDSNVIIDIAVGEGYWAEWSSEQLARLANEASLVINPLIYAEVSALYSRIEDLEAAIPASVYRRSRLPYEAAFLAATVFVTYRRRGGPRCSPLPDFYIGAHAAVAGYRLLTRDVGRYRTYFPGVELVAPDS